MTDFPSNAHASRRPRREQENIKTEEETKAEKLVLKGKVVRRKKSLGTRFKESFLGGEAQDVGGYIVFDILIPTLKELALQIVNEGLEKALWQGRERSGRTRISVGRPRHDYGGYSRSRDDDRDRDRRGRRDISRRTRENHTFEDIILDTRDDANDALDAMDDKIDRYKAASVGDLYNFLGITPDHTDEKWGWTADTFRRAKAVQVRDGFLLDLPPTEPLD